MAPFRRLSDSELQRFTDDELIDYIRQARAARMPDEVDRAVAILAFGYMPTPAQHKVGGYESWLGTNRVEFDAAPKMVTRLLAMMQEMRGGDAGKTQ